jgi:hypothetical protein
MGMEVEANRQHQKVEAGAGRCKTTTAMKGHLTTRCERKNR